MIRDWWTYISCTNYVKGPKFNIYFSTWKDDNRNICGGLTKQHTDTLIKLDNSIDGKQSLPLTFWK